MIYNGKKKSVYKAVYMYKSVFMFFGKGDEQLALDADSVVCRKEEGGAPPPLLSLWHTALSPRSCLKKKKLQNKTEKVAGRARHPGRSTFYAVLPVGGVKGQPPGLTAPPSSFQPPQNSFLPSRAGDDALSSLLRCHWPAAPSVSSVPRGYCCDVTSSRQHHWASPPSPMGSITGLQRWGVGGVSHGGTVRRCKAEPPRLPLSTPQQRSLTED